MNEKVISIEDYAKKLIFNKINFTIIKNNTIQGFEYFTYQDFKHLIHDICHFVFRISYIYLGFIQFFATWTALVKIFHNNNLFIVLTSLFLGFFPFIETLSGLISAHINWGWNYSYSLLFLHHTLLLTSQYF